MQAEALINTDSILKNKIITAARQFARNFNTGTTQMVIAESEQGFNITTAGPFEVDQIYNMKQFFYDIGIRLNMLYDYTTSLNYKASSVDISTPVWQCTATSLFDEVDEPTQPVTHIAKVAKVAKRTSCMRICMWLMIAFAAFIGFISIFIAYLLQ